MYMYSRLIYYLIMVCMLRHICLSCNELNTLLAMNLGFWYPYSALLLSLNNFLHKYKYVMYSNWWRGCQKWQWCQDLGFHWLWNCWLFRIPFLYSKGVELNLSLWAFQIKSCIWFYLIFIMCNSPCYIYWYLIEMPL